MGRDRQLLPSRSCWGIAAHNVFKVHVDRHEVAECAPPSFLDGYHCLLACYSQMRHPLLPVQKDVGLRGPTSVVNSPDVGALHVTCLKPPILHAVIGLYKPSELSLLP